MDETTQITFNSITAEESAELCEMIRWRLLQQNVTADRFQSFLIAMAAESQETNFGTLILDIVAPLPISQLPVTSGARPFVNFAVIAVSKPLCLAYKSGLIHSDIPEISMALTAICETLFKTKKYAKEVSDAVLGRRTTPELETAVAVCSYYLELFETDIEFGRKG